MDNSAAATPVSQPPLASQLAQTAQRKSELQQSHSQESFISNLRTFSNSLSAFQQCFSDLQQHIGSIRTSIDSILLPLQTNNTASQAAPPLASAPEPEPEPEPSWESDPSEDLEEEEEEKYVEVEEKREKEEEEVNSPHSEFKSPGKFYNKGSKAYVNNAPLIQERKAKVLLLEFFLLMMGIDDNKGVVIEKWVKEEAEQAALAWLKRINIEKGVVQAQEIDARGLLLFIGCFGIPDKFKNKNIGNLLQVSNLNWISDAIRRSNVLMGKIPEIIDEMLANKMVVKAVHIVYSVEMQDRFNPKKLLMSFLRESKSSFDKMHGSQGANKENIGVKRKYMNDLKSIIKCLGCHNIDPSKLLGGWQVNTRIMSLEKEIAEFNRQIADQKIAQKNAGFRKRKIDETEWLSNKEVKHSHFSNPWPPQLHQRVVVNHVVSNNTLLEGGGTSGQNYGYSMSPPLHGPVAGSIHGNVVGSLAGPVGGVAMGGSGILPSPQGGSYAGGHGGTRVDSTPGQIGSHAGQLCGLRGQDSPSGTLKNSIWLKAAVVGRGIELGKRVDVNETE
ncbi:hypothetical protein K7X08_003697 [Anisodus acutangulus]|uniref:FRIGIDA-like protein n=1 Tax=Anisodus acutangulus TaxID=402998 RepID=A0A9Q1MHE8_9SOLA|nr:hypothetical protein K7X08_003697 [Anisodus acutangulus]